ncbi:MAG: DUF2848 domain-containing protein [Pseudomonadota bacterium]
MRFEGPDGPIDIEITTLVVAGWTGRDADLVQHHIEELQDIGVAPPTGLPLYYRAAHQLLTHAPVIEVLGTGTSGEVEPLVIQSSGARWLGIAADHTDRELEAVSIAASKQICAKPVSSALWPWAEVADHLDDLILRCDIEEDGAMVRYQEGTLAAIRPLADLIDGSSLGDGGAMLCGTLGAIGGVRPAARYKMALHDPVLHRTLTLSYAVRCLPVVS